MFEVKVGTTPKVPVKLVSSSDHITPATGITPTSIYCSVNGAATPALVTPTWTQLSSTNFPGVYTMTCTAAMTSAAGPLAINVKATNCDDAVIVVSVVDALASEIPFNVWDAQTSGAYDPGSFGKSLWIARKILTNKTKDLGAAGVQVYNDDGITVLGTWTWSDLTGERGTLSGAGALW